MKQPTTMKRQQWKLKPPGPAQQHLENLFTTGEIRGEQTPHECYKRHEVFQNYSLDVFKKKFYATKEKLGCIDDKEQSDKKIGKTLLNDFIEIIKC